MYFVGIDGGGSTLRVVLTRSNYAVLAQHTGPAVNPRLVGFEVAARRIGAGIEAVLAAAGVSLAQVQAAGLGIAGAPAHVTRDWLAEVGAAYLPGVNCRYSADYEIALVGAHGQPHGLLVLSGTGSLAYGMTGEHTALVGGWGYLMGDEGSGFWLGQQVLLAVVHTADGRGPHTALSEAVLAYIQGDSPWALFDWVYEQPTATHIARLAPLALEVAAEGDAVALDILDRGVTALGTALETARQRLGGVQLPVAFAGGLLTNDNLFSQKLVQRLRLPDSPQPRYPPAVGAAILAAEGIAT